MTAMLRDSRLFRLPVALADRARRHGAPAVLAVVVALLAMPAYAETSVATKAVLVGPDLEPRTITVQGMGNGVVSYFDDQGAYRTERFADFLLMRMAAPPAASRSRLTEGMIELTDGQRVRGKWAGAREQSDAVLWSHASLGEAVISLEQLSQLTFGPEAIDPPRDRTGDVVVLANGDRVRGFIESITNREIAIDADEHGAVLRFGLDRVSAVFLASNPAERTAGAHMVHLSDGSRLLAEQLAIREGRLVINTPLFASDSTEHHAVSLDEVVRIVFDSRAGRLVALDDLPREVIAGGSVFGRLRTPRSTERGLVLHAPVTVKIDLPEGATRVTALAVVAPAVRSASDVLAWTDFNLTVRSDGNEVAQFRMHAGQTSRRFNVAIENGSLEIELDPATNGPVGDVLLLADAQVLIEPKSAH